MYNKYRQTHSQSIERMGMIFPVLLSCVYLETTLGFVPSVPTVLAVICAALCVLFAVYLGRVRVDSQCLAFLTLAIPASILFGEPQPIFRSWERYVVFAVIFAMTSPLLESECMRKYRRWAFYAYLCVAALIGSLSFVGYFFGINYMVIETEVVEEYLEQVGTFGGLTCQSMLLGPIAGMGAMAMLYLYLRQRRIYWLALSIACVGSVLFSASRAAFVSLLVGILVLLYLHTGSLTRYIRLIAVVGLLLSVTYPVWNGAMYAVKEKQERHAEDVELFDSRTPKVECRVKEFISSPIYGVGFAAIEPKFKDNYSENGTIEPGSSWLAVFSMTGLIGAAFVLLLYYRAIKALLTHRKGINILVTGCLALMMVHMIVEGYIFAPGSSLCFLCWLLVGVGYDAMYSPATTRQKAYRAPYGSGRKPLYRKPWRR